MLRVLRMHRSMPARGRISSSSSRARAGPCACHRNWRHSMPPGLSPARRCDRPCRRAARVPRTATLPRRRAWLRIFVVGCSLPCDPPVGGHSCNGDDTTLYGCALDEYTGREGAPPCLSLHHARGEPEGQMIVGAYARRQPPSLRGDQCRSRAATRAASLLLSEREFSEMVRIDALAASFRLAYCTTSRSTRVASCCSRWRNACSSAMK